MWTWSAAMARIAQATDTRLVPGLRVTLRQFAGTLRVPIDHVLIPREWDGTARMAGGLRLGPSFPCARGSDRGRSANRP